MYFDNLNAAVLANSVKAFSGFSRRLQNEEKENLDCSKKKPHQHNPAKMQIFGQVMDILWNENDQLFLLPKRSIEPPIAIAPTPTQTGTLTVCFSFTDNSMGLFRKLCKRPFVITEFCLQI